MRVQFSIRSHPPKPSVCWGFRIITGNEFNRGRCPSHQCAAVGCGRTCRLHALALRDEACAHSGKYLLTSPNWVPDRDYR